jgi:hypothetical protein
MVEVIDRSEGPSLPIELFDRSSSLADFHFRPAPQSIPTAW